LASHSDAFVRKLNTNIERYDTALKRWQGRKASDKGETAAENEQTIAESTGIEFEFFISKFYIL
jgi:hypothetical protein